MLDRRWIAAHIPHQGGMCLLDSVREWSAERIRCVSASHRRADNPLRNEGRLGAACGIEYAAQAMAVHGALITGDGKPPRQGYLASVRCVAFNVDRLDDVEGDLDIAAERLAGDDDNILYHFEVRADGRVLLAGRAAVILNAEALK
ncbi:MAG: 3-hydroxylacyl-ACP dehydratase [Rhodocyclaceae bacterium]|jgi:predicted hotdog family 3-hydroxylacyl-ACP dehydratase|nr:3-hydroxylacyl-ACP dehydratase [Rhodocyclaceae bacterium]MBK6554835.1 3-hydroxylacyl-ACP dehydratase [Rhodocyclaceae bacterium]MBK6677206.1 3-hydroxylacyl-ACP dehydratase [Rhodocyclaceae bacterium]MBK9309886.1 3-hydroxylacyl-ACP dehydratase [Rhodocyclaceae bacterium]MBK9953628.1 3-hydroxylacyl-ACP dehydratase [Rhodocyclaceae bacterium]